MRLGTEKFKEKTESFECYEFALQSIIKRAVKALTVDISKVYVEYVPANGKGWIKGKFRIIYPVEEKKK